MGKHVKKKRVSISTKWHQLSRSDKIINATLVVTIGATFVICLIAFIPQHFNQDTKQETISSISQPKNTKAKSNRHSEVSNEKTNTNSTNTQKSNKEQLNKGKVLRFNSVEEAESAIDQHAASCPYGRGQLYSGKVYTGEYFCKCGLKITWWDKRLKESVDEDMASFARDGYSDDEYVYGTDDPGYGNPNTEVSSSESNSQNTTQDSNPEQY